MGRVMIIQKGGHVHTWCADLAAGFTEIGCATHVFTLRSRDWRARREQWAGGGKLWENQATVGRCVAQLSRFRPELILLLNFTGLPEAAHLALRKAAGPDVPVIAWLSDHVSTLPRAVRPNLDAVYAFDSATLDVLADHYGNATTRLEFLPLAVNPARFPYGGRPWAERREGLVFLGNNSPARHAMIRQLRSLGVATTAYGPNAESGLRFWRRRRIPPMAAARIYGTYQGVFNMLQPPNTVHGLNLRAYEVAACGGLGTYPLTPDLARSFVADREIITYQNLDELACKTRELFHQPESATRIIAAGRARVLAEHTYAHRASRFVGDWLPGS
jgi:spore maturation protein CgeB